MITLEEIEKAVEEIRKKKHDDEIAHSLADDLHIEVLQAIAEGIPTDAASAMAKAALMTEQIVFARCCA